VSEKSMCVAKLADPSQTACDKKAHSNATQAAKGFEQSQESTHRICLGGSANLFLGVIHGRCKMVLIQ